MAGDSFSDVMGSFGNSLMFQAKVSAFVRKSEMPAEDVRAFLRARGGGGETQLFRYMAEGFGEIGIGKLSFGGVEGLTFSFAVAGCKLVELYPWSKGQKLCQMTATLLSRVFTEDMGLPCTVTETACAGEGNRTCDFEVKLQPLSAYGVMFTGEDAAILRGVLDGDGVPSDAGERAELLSQMGLLKGEEVSEEGRAFVKFVEAPRPEKPEPEAPWQKKKSSMDEDVFKLMDKAFDKAFKV